MIEYNNSQTETKDINTPETQQIKTFAEKLGKTQLSLSDLETSNNPSTSPKSSKLLWGLGIGAVVLVVGIVVWLIVKNKKEKQT